MEKKLKIYLSKSKAGSMDSLMKVREFLSKYDVEILEFSGEEYSDELLKSADIVLILPHTLPRPFNYDFYLGKGQYVEYNTVTSAEMYFVICLGDELYVSTFDDDDIIDRNWKTDYVHVWCEDTMKPLHIYEPSLVKKSENKQLRVKPFLCLYKL